jgi:hypothetical protein
MDIIQKVILFTKPVDNFIGVNFNSTIKTNEIYNLHYNFWQIDSNICFNLKKNYYPNSSALIIDKKYADKINLNINKTINEFLYTLKNPVKYIKKPLPKLSRLQKIKKLFEEKQKSEYVLVRDLESKFESVPLILITNKDENLENIFDKEELDNNKELKKIVLTENMDETMKYLSNYFIEKYKKQKNI